MDDRDNEFKRAWNVDEQILAFAWRVRKAREDCPYRD